MIVPFHTDCTLPHHHHHHHHHHHPSTPQENRNYLMKVLDLAGMVIYNVEDSEVAGEKKKMDLAVPGKPSFNFFTAK